MRFAAAAWRLLRAVAVKAVKGSLLTIFFGYFALAMLFVLPLNPVKMELLPLLNLTIGTYARQNWSLFAPNPISIDISLLTKCLEQSEVAGALRDEASGTPTGGWSDVSLPMWEAFHANRFSAYDRLTRPQSNAIRAFLGANPMLGPWRDACGKCDQSACDRYAARLKDAQQVSAIGLRRIGSAYCNGRATAGAYEMVALRARLSSAVPWSQRHDPSAARKSSDVSLGVYRIDRQVASAAPWMVAR
jgi:Family of unknown function (DUF5819)